MSLQEITLPPFIIADLYKDVLVETTTNTNIKEANRSIVDTHFEIKSLGENKKNISIVVSDRSAVYLADEKLELLSKLLAACKLNIADVAIINTSDTPVKYNQIKEKLTPKHLLLFGIDIKQFEIPMVFPEYRIQNYDNCQIVISTGLENLLGNDENTRIQKSKLWLCLKTMFNV